MDPIEIDKSNPAASRSSSQGGTPVLYAAHPQSTRSNTGKTLHFDTTFATYESRSYRSCLPKVVEGDKGRVIRDWLERNGNNASSSQRAPHTIFSPCPQVSVPESTTGRSSLVPFLNPSRTRALCFVNLILHLVVIPCTPKEAMGLPTNASLKALLFGMSGRGHGREIANVSYTLAS